MKQHLNEKLEIYLNVIQFYVSFLQRSLEIQLLIFGILAFVRIRYIIVISRFIIQLKR